MIKLLWRLHFILFLLLRARWGLEQGFTIVLVLVLVRGFLTDFIFSCHQYHIAREYQWWKLIHSNSFVFNQLPARNSCVKLILKWGRFSYGRVHQNLATYLKVQIENCESDERADLFLRKIYELYSDFALKNPFYSLEMPIRAGYHLHSITNSPHLHPYLFPFSP